MVEGGDREKEKNQNKEERRRIENKNWKKGYFWKWENELYQKNKKKHS